jgi:hypothetical protein
MKALLDNDTIQIEITNHCHKRCANCTRFVGHVQKQYHMDFDTFKHAVDSLVGFPHMVGIMGGEPLLHPEFERFCEYALSKIPRIQLGLWSAFPEGHESYRETICKTFGNILLNDHTRADIMHHPFLVAIEEVVQDKGKMWNKINKCWAQESWSPSINPHGAYFCEMAAAFAMLFEGTVNFMPGWPIESRWWERIPKDYTAQMEWFCPLCGGAAQLKRRSSLDKFDDISPLNLKRLKPISQRIRAGKYKLHSLIEVGSEQEMGEMQSYKNQGYRDVIAARYRIFLTHNELGFNDPKLMRVGRKMEMQPTYIDKLKARYAA